MLIFLLSFFFFQSYGAQNKLLVFCSNQNSVYFFKQVTADETRNLDECQIKEIQDYLIPPGKYSCEFPESEKTGQDQVAFLSFHDKDKAMAGHLTLSYDNRNDDKKVFDQNFISILNNKNFANPHRSTIALSQSFRNKLDFITLLRSCFKQNHVQITLVDEQQKFTQQEWDQKDSVFDVGIALHVNEFLYKKTVLCGRDNLQVPIQTFISAIKKYSYSDLTWYEKIMNLFDTKYLYTKGFFQDKAFVMTLKYSQAFRKKCILFIRPLVATMIMALLLLKLHRSR